MNATGHSWSHFHFVVYEGYFSKIHYTLVADGDRSEGNDLALNDNFSGFWRISSRLPQKVKWRYEAVTNSTSQVHKFNYFFL